MNDQDFKDKVLSTLAEVRTDVKWLVGADGREGIVPEHARRIKALEDSTARTLGFAAGVSALVGFFIHIFR